MIVLASWVKCPLVFYPGSNFINLVSACSKLVEHRTVFNLADDSSLDPFLVDFRVPALLHILMSGLVVSELAVESLV